MLIGRWRWIGKATKAIDWLTRSAAIVVGAVAKTKVAGLPAVLAPPIQFLQQSWLAPTILIAAPVVFWLRTKTDQSRMEAVRDVLDRLCETTFDGEEFDHEQNRRVTLFKHQTFYPWRLPWFGGWLVPVERSGKLTRKTSAIFRAPDDGELAEGVAGRAWSGKRKLKVLGLPDIRRKGTTDREFSEYAEKAFCDVNKLRNWGKGPPQARALYGVYIEVGNKPWGVIVVDSVKTEIATKKFDGAFKHLGPTLSSYLKGL